MVREGYDLTVMNEVAFTPSLLSKTSLETRQIQKDGEG